MPDWDLTAQGFRIFSSYFLHKVQKNQKYRVWDIDRLCALASETGSTAKVYETSETNRMKISDPLCRMLETAGMNA